MSAWLNEPRNHIHLDVFSGVTGYIEIILSHPNKVLTYWCPKLYSEDYWVLPVFQFRSRIKQTLCLEWAYWPGRLWALLACPTFSARHHWQEASSCTSGKSRVSRRCTFIHCLIHPTDHSHGSTIHADLSIIKFVCFSCSVWRWWGAPCSSLLPLLVHQWHATQLQAPWPAVQHGASWGLAQVQMDTKLCDVWFLRFGSSTVVISKIIAAYTGNCYIFYKILSYQYQIIPTEFHIWFIINPFIGACRDVWQAGVFLQFAYVIK